MPVINTRGFRRFWPVSWTIAYRFGVPERFPRLTIPGMRLRDRRKYSQFWPIVTRFVAYCSPLSGPETISIVAEPQGVHTCQSSTLAVLADSGPFRGLLLTVLGSRSDFHDRRTPVCVYVSVINTRSFGRFWPVSWTTTHSFGIPE